MNKQQKRDDLEVVIIGILLRHPDKIFTRPIQRKWFRRYQAVIDAILKMSGEGLEIDAVTLKDYLGDNYDLETVVHWQVKTFGGQSNYEHYLAKLEEFYVETGIQQEFSKSVANINHGDAAKDVLSDFLTSVNEMQNEDGKNYNYDMKEALNIFVDDLTIAFDKGEEVGLKLGFADIDAALGGIQETDMVIVGARPAVGKTSFALSAIRNIAQDGKRIGFFSTEMSVSQVMGRLVSMDSNINGLKLRQANLEEQDFTRISASTAKLKNYSLRICDKPSITANEIMMQSRSWHITGGLDLIVVDYLTRIKSDKKHNNQNLEIGDIVTTMKNIARVLKVPVLVLAQLNRNVEKKGNKRPAMSDLRDSGIIEQEADQILLLNRPSDEPEEEEEQPKFSERFNKKPESKPAVKPRHDEIIIDKNRHGITGVYRVEFNKELAMWSDFNYGN